MEMIMIGEIGASGTKAIKSASDTVSVEAGKALKIETTPDGEELLNVTCPSGKVWTTTITVNVIETDAA